VSWPSSTGRSLAAHRAVAAAGLGRAGRSVPTAPDSHIFFSPSANCIWNPVHLVYGGTYRYVPVRTGTYRYVLLYSMYQYVLLVIFRITVHTSTYWYVLVQKNHQKYVRVRTSRCLSRFMAVHGGTWQYMQNSITVYGST
jgi:hypothetical protein